MSNYTIIQDTREQKNWFFSGIPVEVQTLKTGDYTIKGLENKLCIERKGTICEFAQNLVQPRFEKELARMGEIEHNFLLLEFSMSDLLYYPQTAPLSKAKKEQIQINGNFLLRKMLELAIAYNVNFLFCDSRTNAMRVAESIFKRIYARYN